MFTDRRQAGKLLADELLAYKDAKPFIYALPRGGLPVADEVARRLDAPLDIIFVRKLGAPGQKEFAIGAVVDGAAPTAILHQDIIAKLNIPEAYIKTSEAAALSEIERRRELYLKDKPPLSPKGRTVIIVDDGVATGATMQAAVAAMRKAGATQIIAAAPVASRDAKAALEKTADVIVTMKTPFPFWSVGNWYYSFPQLTDKDVIGILGSKPDMLDEL